MQNNEETIAKYAVNANLVRLVSINPKKNPSPWMLFTKAGKAKKMFQEQKFKNISILKHFHMKDVESAESKEKSHFRFIQFLFL